MHDIITIGSAIVDIFMKSKQFHLQQAEGGVLLCEQYGEKLDIDDFTLQSGGAGTNTAVGFARLGFKTAAVVEIGKDFFGQVMWDELKRERVDTQFVITEKNEDTGLSVLLIANEGGRSVLTHRGASSQLEVRDIPWQALQETRWIHLSNISGNKEVLIRLFDHVRRAKVGLSWNPGEHELHLLAAHHIQIDAVVCDIFFVNNEEWMKLHDVQEALIKHVPTVVVTDGKKGGRVYFRGEYKTEYTAHDVKTVQETGAGDAFCVGFIAAHLSGKEVSEAAEWGVRNAGSVVQHMGAKTGLLRKKDLT